LSWLRIALLYLIVLPATRVMGWPRISGEEHLRNARGPLVFICNHVTMVDHALVLLALPGRFRTRMAIAMDGEQLREWLHPQPGTGLLIRLIRLLKYVPSFSSSMSFRCRKRAAFGGALCLPAK
jgi:long-chain acyl-CoA synthetase